MSMTRDELLAKIADVAAEQVELAAQFEALNQELDALNLAAMSDEDKARMVRELVAVQADNERLIREEEARMAAEGTT